MNILYLKIKYLINLDIKSYKFDDFLFYILDNCQSDVNIIAKGCICSSMLLIFFNSSSESVFF